jgi:hypothetical protein
MSIAAEAAADTTVYAAAIRTAGIPYFPCFRVIR